MGSRDGIGVLVVDDHTVVREGLCSLIEARTDMYVVGEASDGAEAVRMAITLHPDVILLDLVMPHMGGIEAIAEIKRNDPQARILVLTSFEEGKRVYQAIKGGALGYLLKDSSSADLISAIQRVYEGELALQPSVALKMIREVGRAPGPTAPVRALSPREDEVLRLLARGLSDREIALRLTISERTVNKHISSILGKLHLDNRTQAALYAAREGLGPQND